MKNGSAGKIFTGVFVVLSSAIWPMAEDSSKTNDLVILQHFRAIRDPKFFSEHTEDKLEREHLRIPAHNSDEESPDKLRKYLRTRDFAYDNSGNGSSIDSHGNDVKMEKKSLLALGTEKIIMPAFDDGASSAIDDDRSIGSKKRPLRESSDSEKSRVFSELSRILAARMSRA